MNKSLFFVLSFIGLLSLRAGEGTRLWVGDRELGGWRAFGGGMLAAKAQSEEVSLAVNWPDTSFGVGAVFEKPLPLPDVSRVTRLVVEARSSEANGTALVPEWVQGDKAWRVAEDRQPPLAPEWETYVFEVPGDFPRFAGQESAVTGLRLLFVNPARPGRADVYFRNVRLEP